MTEFLIRLSLPDTLREGAEANDLLQPAAIEKLLREEFCRRRVNGLFAAADQLADLELPPLTAAEVQAEIQVARQARRVRQAA